MVSYVLLFNLFYILLLQLKIHSFANYLNLLQLYSWQNYVTLVILKEDRF